MEFYEIIKTDGDDIFIEKVIIDLDDCGIVELENNIKIIRKNIHITNINDLKLFNFNYSKILECTIINYMKMIKILNIVMLLNIYI